MIAKKFFGEPLWLDRILYHACCQLYLQHHVEQMIVLSVRWQTEAKRGLQNRAKIRIQDQPTPPLISGKALSVRKGRREVWWRRGRTTGWSAPFWLVKKLPRLTDMTVRSLELRQLPFQPTILT